jgi:outer membrane biosynthesis protein TonB
MAQENYDKWMGLLRIEIARAHNLPAPSSEDGLFSKVNVICAIGVGVFNEGGNKGGAGKAYQDPRQPDQAAAIAKQEEKEKKQEKKQEEKQEKKQEEKEKKQEEEEKEKKQASEVVYQEKKQEKKEKKQEEQKQANAQSLAEWTASCEARDAKLEEEQEEFASWYAAF